MSHAFIEGIYATAHRHLRIARREQQWALGYAAQQYLGGHVGSTARRLFLMHNGKRAEAVQQALACRAQARQLRAKLAGLAAADTIPPAAQVSA